MEFQIRACDIQDAEVICVLNTKGMGYDYPIELTRKKLEKLLSSPHDRIFVAVANDVVVGYVHANDYDVLYAPHMKNIMGIAIADKFRKKGVGKALLTAVEDWARETGAQGIRLVSGAARAGAHEFYRRCGYQESHRQVNFKKTF